MKQDKVSSKTIKNILKISNICALSSLKNRHLIICICFYKIYLSHVSNTMSRLMMFIFFVWGLSSHLKKISLVRRRHHYRWKASNFDICSALMAIEQWGFFFVSHLLSHGASFYNGHLRGSVTLILIAERKAVELLLPVFTT